MKKVAIKEFSNIRFSEPVLMIEYCSNCSQHNNSLRHSEQKYLQKAIDLKTVVQREFPFFKIVLKPLDTSKPESVKRLGLFEVTMGLHDSKEPKLLGSKLRTLQWPETRTVVSNIRSAFAGRDIRVTLKLPNEKHFHPKNVVSNSIKVVLASEFDLPILREKLLGHDSHQRALRAATTMGKQRKLSAIVQKKIQSGVEKETEINELLVPKQFIAEQRPNSELFLHFQNVKPGAYKLLVVKNSNFDQSSTDLLVTPPFRQKDGHVDVHVNLTGRQSAFLDLAVEAEVDNPVFGISLEKVSLTNQTSQAEEELVLRTQSTDGSRNTLHYCVTDLGPEAYKLVVEYKDYQTVKETIRVYPGLNAYKVRFPQLDVVYHASTPKHGSGNPGESQAGCPLEDSQHMNRQSECSKSKVKHSENSDRKPSKKQPANDNKENQKNQSEAKKKNDPGKHDNRPNSDFDRLTEDDRPTFPKQRGTSGNRIRPGERLHSAKSKNNQQISDQLTKGAVFISPDLAKARCDPTVQTVEKHAVPDCLNIFLRLNDVFKLEFEFVIDKNDSIEDQSHFYQEQVVEGTFEHHCLRHIPGFEFGRIFVERLKADSNSPDPAELVLVNGSRVAKVNLTDYFAQLCNEDETFCDVAFIVNNQQQDNFEEIVSLVPLAEPIKCFTGIMEIRNIMSFVKNSKFEVSKFFGFEFEEEEDNLNFTLSQAEVVESLKNYEIQFSDNYVLNAVRVDRKGNVSVQKLHDTYAQWQRMIDGIENMNFEEEDEDIEEQDEDFEGEANETGQFESEKKAEEFADEDFED
jgi:hypothetical protein